MSKRPLVPRTMIHGSEHGQVEKPISALAHDGASWEQISLTITEDYANLVQEYPDYEFGIIGNNETGMLRITWKKRE